MDKNLNDYDTNLIPWEDCPHSITNEIAFEIGRGDYPRFYDIPIWSPNIESFRYAKFFKWAYFSQYGGRNGDGEYYSKWVFYGSLREELFVNDELKRSYIKGVLLGSGDKKLSKCIFKDFINSFETRDRVAKWVNEILKNKFGTNKRWNIVSEDYKDTIPGIAKLCISSDEEVIDFILN